MEREHRWITVPEYAEIMGLHEATVRRLCKDGQICAEKTGGSWRVYYEPPAQTFVLDKATKDAVSMSVKTCITVVDAAIDALKAMREEINEMNEEVCACR